MSSEAFTRQEIAQVTICGSQGSMSSSTTMTCFQCQVAFDCPQSTEQIQSGCPATLMRHETTMCAEPDSGSVATSRMPVMPAFSMASQAVAVLLTEARTWLSLIGWPSRDPWNTGFVRCVIAVMCITGEGPGSSP